MATFKEYLIEADKKLEKLVWDFRKKEEKTWEWKTDKQAMKGMCQDITRRLEKYLKKNGYKANRVPGYYKDVSDDFEPEGENWDFDDWEDYRENFDNSWTHWWVLVNNRIIVDVTADQFHLGEEDEYRVVITRKGDRDYD